MSHFVIGLVISIIDFHHSFLIAMFVLFASLTLIATFPYLVLIHYVYLYPIT